jgi:thiol-disulfide isomerase/thioredoxin
MAQIDSKVGSQTIAQPGGSSNRMFILAIAAVAVIGLAVIAILATSRGDDTAATPTGADGAEVAAVEVTQGSLDPLPQGVRVGTAETDPAFGTLAPTLVGTGFDGTEVRIEPDGRPKAIYFVAHWCPHCQEEVPVVEEMAATAAADGLDLYAVSTGVDDGQGNFPPSAWLATDGPSLVAVRDDENSSAFLSFGGAGFPYAVYLDADHRVVARSSGNLNADATRQLWAMAVAGQ